MPKARSAGEPRGLNATAGTILGFLIDEPLSGYEIYRRVQTTVGDFWNVTQSQVYREIANLELAGFIRPGRTGARARKRYALLPAGKAAFLEWATLEPSDAIVRDPFFLKVFFADQLDRSTLLRFVRARRAQAESHLARSVELDQRTPEGPAKRALQFVIRYQRALLEWLDTLPWK
jgi:DNA-binding PadR family transcriptional regulator